MSGVDPKLLEILVCPLCKGPLRASARTPRAGLQGRPPGLPDQGRHPGDAGGGSAQAAARKKKWLEVSRHHPGALRVDALSRQAARRPRAASRWWCASASARAQSGAAGVHVATDDERICDAVRAHGYRAMHDARRPSFGHRPASPRRRSSSALRRRTIVVNVQGDEPLIAPALITAGGRGCSTRKRGERVHRLPPDPRRAVARAIRTWSRWCSMPRATRSTSRARAFRSRARPARRATATPASTATASAS